MAEPGSNGQIEKYFETGWSIWRFASSKDASGGLIKTPTKQKDIIGRLNAKRGMLTMLNNKKTETLALRFYCPIEDIKAGDEIRKDTKRYEVLWPNDVMSFNQFMQIDVQEVI